LPLFLPLLLLLPLLFLLALALRASPHAPGAPSLTLVRRRGRQGWGTTNLTRTPLMQSAESSMHQSSGHSDPCGLPCKSLANSAAPSLTRRLPAHSSRITSTPRITKPVVNTNRRQLPFPIYDSNPTPSRHPHFLRQRLCRRPQRDKKFLTQQTPNNGIFASTVLPFQD
jgi:hypothetical protein